MYSTELYSVYYFAFVAKAPRFQAIIIGRFWVITEVPELCELSPLNFGVCRRYLRVTDRVVDRAGGVRGVRALVGGVGLR